jgi:hypothetical protein
MILNESRVDYKMNSLFHEKSTAFEDSIFVTRLIKSVVTKNGEHRIRFWTTGKPSLFIRISHRMAKDLLIKLASLPDDTLDIHIPLHNLSKLAESCSKLENIIYINDACCQIL